MLYHPTLTPHFPLLCEYDNICCALQVEGAVAKALETHGRLSGVANCVGSIVLKAAHQTSDVEFDQAREMCEPEVYVPLFGTKCAPLSGFTTNA